MGRRGYVYAHKDTVAGNEMIISATGIKFGGFYLNGSADGDTITIKDGGTTIFSTAAGAGAVISIILNVPIACTTSLLSTLGDTGACSVFYTT